MYNQIDFTTNEILSFLVKEDLCVITKLLITNNKCYCYDTELLEYILTHCGDVFNK